MCGAIIVLGFFYFFFFSDLAKQLNRHAILQAIKRNPQPKSSNVFCGAVQSNLRRNNINTASDLNRNKENEDKTFKGVTRKHAIR